MAMIGKVRRMRHRQKKSVREIARITSLSRNTVRKWLRAPTQGEPKYRRGTQPRKLSPFHERLEQALKADSHRPKHERRSARALYAELKLIGYDGGYSRVTDFIRDWRLGEGHAVGTSAFVPLAFELGEAFQFDWSEEGLVVGGIYYRLQVAHMKLCASRAFWLVAYPSQGHEMLFDAHTRSFAALGGIARRGISDFVAGNKMLVMCPPPLCGRRRVMRRVVLGESRACGNIIGYRAFNQSRSSLSSFQTALLRPPAEVTQTGSHARNASALARSVNSAYRLVVSRLT